MIKIIIIMIEINVVKMKMVFQSIHVEMKLTIEIN